MSKYFCAVIGGGPAGYRAALRLAGMKKNVCLIERAEQSLGGTCLNEGCVPMKSLLESARLYRKINSSPGGLSVSVSKPGLESVMSRAGKSMDALRLGLSSLLKRSGVDLVFGEASFSSPSSIKVARSGGDTEVHAERFIIASGSEPGRLAGFEPGGSVIDTAGAFRLGDLPEDILIVGGGVTGCEFASAFSMLGARVTVAEVRKEILPLEDPDTSRFIRRELSKSGVEIITGARASLIYNGADGARVMIESGKSGAERVFRKVLVATGRRPAAGGLSLEKAGLRLDSGAVAVSGDMSTSAGRIFAAGDITGINMTAHAAYVQGEAAASSAAGLAGDEIDYCLVPRVLFTQPQAAGIGLTEAKAREKGYNLDVRKAFFRANAKAVLAGEPEGYLKVITEKGGSRVLGAAMTGPSATELIHLLAPACAGMLSLDDLRRLVYAHPTLSEIMADL